MANVERKAARVSRRAALRAGTAAGTAALLTSTAGEMQAQPPMPGGGASCVGLTFEDVDIGGRLTPTTPAGLRPRAPPFDVLTQPRGCRRHVKRGPAAIR